jgi:uncharacterized protein DUF4430
VQHRIVALALAAALAATFAPVAGAIQVRVRVEGASTTLYGAEQPRVTPFTGTLTQGEVTIELSRPTALGALETASVKGEVYYRLVPTSFGPFVAQIGRLSGEASSGWVYKVNGESPPVGADAFVLEEGDVVLWYYATFGETGGPPTLDLRRAGRRCYQAFSQNDAGVATQATNVTFHRDGRPIADEDGRLCPIGHWHRLRVTKDGAVRSQVVRPR